ncbi:MAG: hypothetical protein H6810_08665 [Phycisphaeraceae bacterium]|nr:MAG: hypothetical protein H6810_08665 [Phycisphaeraceae bacterium]
MKAAPILTLVVAALLLPGCVIQDIHKELKGANARLDRVEDALGHIDTTNAQLTALQARLRTLDKIDSVDASLKSIDGQLDSIEESLRHLDEHLASLRKTINNIDSTIPFLKISGDDEGDEGNAETGEAGGGGDQKDAGPTPPPGEPTKQPESAPTTGGGGSGGGSGGGR